MEQAPNQATRKELCEQLKDHYREVSHECSNFNNGIIKAIDAYEREIELESEIQILKSALNSIANMKVNSSNLGDCLSISMAIARKTLNERLGGR